jgi:hypothetical protein
MLLLKCIILTRFNTLTLAVGDTKQPVAKQGVKRSSPPMGGPNQKDTHRLRLGSFISAYRLAMARECSRK